MQGISRMGRGVLSAAGSGGTSVKLPLTIDLMGKVSGGVTFTRASDQWSQDDAGGWQRATAGTPAFNSKGILLEPASTNKCTCHSVPNNAVGIQSRYNAGAWVQNHTNMALSGDTAATLTTVDDTAALLAAGLQNLCPSGKVYELNNPGATSAFVDIEGMTNAGAHSLSVFARRLSGVDASNFFIALTDSTGIVPLNSASYVRVISENTAINHSNQKLRIRVPSGNVCRFILPQLEELPFATSPVVTAGATANRVATVLSFPANGNLPSNDFTVITEVTAVALNVSAYPKIISTTADGSGQNVQIQYSPAMKLHGQRTTSGPVYNATNPNSVITLGVAAKVAVAFTSTGIRGATSGVLHTPNANGTPIVSPGVVTFPSTDAVKYVRNFRIFRRALSDSQLVALTA